MALPTAAPRTTWAATRGTTEQTTRASTPTVRPAATVAATATRRCLVPGALEAWPSGCPYTYRRIGRNACRFLLGPLSGHSRQFSAVRDTRVCGDLCTDLPGGMCSGFSYNSRRRICRTHAWGANAIAGTRLDENTLFFCHVRVLA